MLFGFKIVDGYMPAFTHDHNFIVSSSERVKLKQKKTMIHFILLTQYNNYVNKYKYILDLIFCNIINVENVSLCSLPLVPEDDNHTIPDFELKIEPHSHRNYKLQNYALSLNYAKADLESINREMSEIQWVARFSGSNAKSVVEHFTVLLMILLLNMSLYEEGNIVVFPNGTS